ncbi:hypothetical protein [Microlunatus soli]|nr:hypothetical protein [Microlunatus soli]
MSLTAQELVAAPRGRSLCLATAEVIDESVAAAWMGAGFRPEDRTKVDELGRVLDRLDVAAVRGWTDPLVFIGPVAHAVDFAMAWQEPEAEDVVAADPAVIEALLPIGEAILASPAAGWWQSPIDLSTLRHTSKYDDAHPPEPPGLAGAADLVRDWRRSAVIGNHRDQLELPDDPTAPYSGVWWSSPSGRNPIPTSTRTLDGLGSIKLVWEEDSFGQCDALVRPLAVTGSPRVYEIDCPQAWTELVRRYPLDVSASRRHDWYRATGRDGGWLIPDYVAVAADWDAIHLTVAGYLSTALRALPVVDGHATVLAGWDPDQTWWLADLLQLAGPAEHWRSVESADGPDLGWQPVSAPGR